MISHHKKDKSTLFGQQFWFDFTEHKFHIKLDESGQKKLWGHNCPYSLVTMKNTLRPPDQFIQHWYLNQCWSQPHFYQPIKKHSC